MKRPCPRCGAPVKTKRKYCTWACSVAARTVIDRQKAAQLRQRGLTFEQIATYIPASAGSICTALHRHGAA